MEDYLPNIYTACYFTPMRRERGANSLIWPNATNGSLNQSAGHWLNYHGRITGIFEKPRSVGWFGLNRIWLWVKDWELVSAGVGGLWVWCSQGESEEVRGSSHSHQRQWPAIGFAICNHSKYMLRIHNKHFALMQSDNLHINTTVGQYSLFLTHGYTRKRLNSKKKT